MVLRRVVVWIGQAGGDSSRVGAGEVPALVDQLGDPAARPSRSRGRCRLGLLLGRIGGALLEVVGVVFDGNIESLPGDYIYLPQRNRSITVDVRAILEALDEIYDSDRLVLELTTGQLVDTEAEADRAGR